MTSGLVGRQIMPMQPKNRFGDLGTPPTTNIGETSRASRAPLGTGFGSMNTSYGGNIWGNGTFSSTFGSSTRDSSRTREGSSLLPTNSDQVQGKKGSGALVSTSESDDWGTPWPNRDTHSTSRSTSQVRAAGVSPVRQRSSNGLPASQPYQNSSVFAPPNLTSAVGQPSNRTAFETNSASFKSNRSMSNFPAHFPNGSASYMDPEPLRAAETALGSWADTSMIQSSPDERASIHSPDYFAGSNFPSREASLPPSRHGQDSASMSTYRETPQRGHQTQSSFAIPRHGSSISSQTNGGAYNDRPISQETDLNSHFRRMSLQPPDQSAGFQKPVLNVNGVSAHFSSGSQDFGSRNPSLSGFSQQLPSFNDHNIDSSQFSTPNRIVNLRAMQLRERQTQALPANGDYHPPHPYYSAESTPPRGYGSSGLANGDHRNMVESHTALLDSRLRGLQQKQNPTPNLGPNLSQMMASPYQIPYGQAFPYGPPQTLPGMNGLGQYIPMHPMPGMMPVMEVPKAPRDHDMGHGMRSALLDEFKTNQKAKRYELKDIYEHIVEFSGDQHGSRFIQTKLETANSDEKDRVFREIQPNALQLMSDVFGNYVIQKFFEHGDQTQKKTLASKMKGQVYTLSTQMYACRVVQKALEYVLIDQQASIVNELEPKFLECVKDQNGNHVIQKAIERVPAEYMRSAVNAFAGKVHDLSTHPYGCRVIQRMIEHCEPHIKRSVLNEISSCEATLIPDQYGNYVTQHVIELGSDEDRARVHKLVKAQLIAFSKHKYASNVVERVLYYATDQQRREIMDILTEKNERGDGHLVMMIKDGFANYVIQRVLDTLQKTDYLEFVEILRPEVNKAKRVASSKQIQAIEHKTHRFDPEPPYGLNIPTPPSISTNISAATTPPPPLTGSGQSPQSSSLPSASISTVDDPVQNVNGVKPVTEHDVDIAP